MPRLGAEGAAGPTYTNQQKSQVSELSDSLLEPDDRSGSDRVAALQNTTTSILETVIMGRITIS